MPYTFNPFTGNLDFTADSAVISTPYLPLSGGTVRGNLTITGNLSGAGITTFFSTNYTTTTALSVQSTGPGSAVYVYKGAIGGPVATFNSSTGNNLLYVDNNATSGNTGIIGINTSVPNQALTVVGNTSATNISYFNGSRASQGVPNNYDSSTNGYAFGTDGDTGVFSPVLNPTNNNNSGNGVVSLFGNEQELLRVDAPNALVTLFRPVSALSSVTGTAFYDASGNSIQWNNTTKNFNLSSGSWNTTTTAVKISSIIWNDTYKLATLLQAATANYATGGSVANASNWDTAFNLATALQSVTGNYVRRTEINNVSGNWNSAYASTTALNLSTDIWNDTYTKVSQTSNNWNSAYVSTTALNLSAGSWNGTYTSVNRNSNNWNSAYASTTALNLSAGNWNKAYNISTAYQGASGAFATNTDLNSVSGTLLTTVSSTSGSLYTTIANTSGSLNTTISNVLSSLYTTINTASGNLTTLVSGTSSTLYTTINNVTALLVPTTTLQSVTGSLLTTINTVSGNLNTTINSTSSLLLPTTVYQNASGTFATNTNLNSLTGSLLTTINTVSGNLNTTINSTSSLLLPTTVYQNTSGSFVQYTDINSVSGNWDSAYASTTAINLSTSNWNNSYTSVTNTSGNWNTAYSALTAIPYRFVNTTSIQPISGGSTVSGTYSVITGGYDNCIEAGVTYSFIGGGGGTSVNSGNCAYSNQTVIGGGNKNEVHGIGSAILGGLANITDGDVAVVVGGTMNNACAIGTFVGGGQINKINNSANYSSIIGGSTNIVNHSNSHIIGSNITTTASNYTFVNNLTSQGTVAANSGSFQSLTAVSLSGTFYGDGSNLIGASLPGQADINTLVRGTSSDWNSAYVSTTAINLSVGNWNELVVQGAPYTLNKNISSIQPRVGYNTASGYYSNVAGGRSNVASNDFSNIAGGYCNNASGYISNVAGGFCNNASANYSNVAGGAHNTASAYYSNVAGGRSNTASGPDSNVAGGSSNTASGYYSNVAGGRSNTASGNCSSILGGSANDTNLQDNTFILGSGLTATQPNYTYVNNLSSQGAVYGTFYGLSLHLLILQIML